MFERYTDRARRAIVLAQDEARALNHNYIGTGHILLGLLREGEGVAAKALTALGLSLEEVRKQVETVIGKGGATPTGHVPFTDRAKKVMELSLREALQLGHNYIGTEHILLGLIREGEGVAAQVLVKLGAELTRVRERVIQVLSNYQPQEPAVSPGWVKKVRQVSVFVVQCSYCSANITEGMYTEPHLAVEAAQEAGAVLMNLGGMTFDGPPVACTACQQRPLSDFQEAS